MNNSTPLQKKNHRKLPYLKNESFRRSFVSLWILIEVINIPIYFGINAEYTWVA